MKCLVTGGAGFIGSHVADALLAAGHDVLVLDDLSGGFRENVPTRASFVEGSITDVKLVNRLFAADHYEGVFHLAAYAAEGLSHFIKRFNYENNLVGSVNLINAAVNYHTRCFVFTSSIAVYGTGQSPLSETMVPEPEDSYGIAKLAVEKELEVSHRMFGLNYVIFRPHNVYGERQNIGDKYRNVIGIFMNQIMQGKPMTVFGDGTQTRAFTHIADVAPVIARSIELPGSWNTTYNIGADTPHSVKTLAEKVASAMGVKPEFQHLDPRNEVLHAFSDHARVQQRFGTSNPLSLEEGLRRMAAWAKEAGAKESKSFNKIEINEKLPPSWK
jgi:UDP-glucose 4-epimerase